MRHRRTWYGSIAYVARHFTRPEQVSVSVRLDGGVPVKDIGRVVEIHLPPERALDWSAELASHARSVRRQNAENGDARYTAPTGENLTRYVSRLLRDFAEDTGVQDDDLETQIADLMTGLMIVAGRNGVDPDRVIDKAREYLNED